MSSKTKFERTLDELDLSQLRKLLTKLEEQGEIVKQKIKKLERETDETNTSNTIFTSIINSIFDSDTDSDSNNESTKSETISKVKTTKKPIPKKKTVRPLRETLTRDSSDSDESFEEVKKKPTKKKTSVSSNEKRPINSTVAIMKKQLKKKGVEVPDGLLKIEVEALAWEHGVVSVSEKEYIKQQNKA